MTAILSYLGFTTVVEVGSVHLRDFRHEGTWGKKGAILHVNSLSTAPGLAKN